MRLPDHHVIAGLFFPVLAEGFVVLIVQLTRGVVGDVQKLNIFRQYAG